MVVTLFEQLCNDLFWDIFDYLELVDIYVSFYGLNCRINSKIHSIPSLHLDHRAFVSSKFANHLATIVDRVVSLNVIGATDSLSLTRFYVLQSLTISDMQHKDLIIIMLDIYESNTLKSLTVSLNYSEPDDIEDIYSMIICNRLPKTLKTSQIINNIKAIELITFGKVSTVCQSIEHLYLKSCFTNCSSTTTLFRLFSYMPNLKYAEILPFLNCNMSSRDKINPQSLLMTSIKAFHSTCVVFSIDYIDLLLSIMPSLIVLRLICYSNDKNIIDAWQWEQIILRRIPLLKKLILDINTQCHTTSDDLRKDEGFRTDFWLNRNWFVSLQVARHMLRLFVWTSNQDCDRSGRDETNFCSS
ncbi:unnamed protein product [Didymodactylos carnosus]|uniref:Uncharacterized protein n=1 Tax=Didymodactylos carnosus TaxID=1234261 RepID=A0A815QV52_9BILA|nr:unnamed protein product [Didymodactylos carnosus]CAF1466937.1 unnamed protein product [Didymodactylos carnosus]CAF3706413.1 unnamed protein product [Didymodactylos carnosus]CAF4335785.1 unnamed protein product [Didymodactylos carnosus]